MTESFAIVVVTILVVLGIIGAAVAWWINRPRHGEHANPDASLELFSGDLATEYADTVAREHHLLPGDGGDEGDEGHAGDEPELRSPSPLASAAEASVGHVRRDRLSDRRSAVDGIVDLPVNHEKRETPGSADLPAYDWTRAVAGGPARRESGPDRLARVSAFDSGMAAKIDKTAIPPAINPKPQKLAVASFPPAQFDPSIAHGRSVRFEIPADGTLQFLPGRLEIVNGHDSGREIRFVRLPGASVPEITFGRSEGVRYRHVQLMEGTVSRLHARMRHAEPSGGWTLMNLSSTNPVAYNGRILGENEEQALKDEDRIEMGEVVFRFRER